MSTSASTETATRQRILDAALDLANRDGIESVSVRAVATVLDLSPGNVSYHFARRADLLTALADQLSMRNEPLGEIVPRTVADLLERYRRAMLHQYEHRGIVVALPHLVDSVPELGLAYREVERQRFAQQRRQLSELADRGELRFDAAERERVLATLVFIARFWLGEYQTTHRSAPAPVVIDHYLALMAHALIPVASDAASARLGRYASRLIQLP